MATLNVRPIDDEAARKIKRSAAARGLTIGQYLARLADLHEAALQQPHVGMESTLRRLGIEQVQV